MILIYPRIDNSISNNAYPLSLCNLLLDTFDTFGFQQLVTFPTRRHNTLDIFATNRPPLVEKCEPIPGIGDHESVLIESLLMAKYIPPAQRTIYLWSKANYTHLSDIIADFSRRFLSECTVESPVQQLWHAVLKIIIYAVTYKVTA